MNSDKDEIIRGSMVIYQNKIYFYQLANASTCFLYNDKESVGCRPRAVKQIPIAYIRKATKTETEEFILTFPQKQTMSIGPSVSLTDFEIAYNKTRKKEKLREAYMQKAEEQFEIYYKELEAKSDPCKAGD
jgi:hypothetical protein